MEKVVIIKEKMNHIILKDTTKSEKMGHKLDMISTINITENGLVFKIY